MFNVIISFSTQSQWQFLFNNYERAESVIKNYKEANGKGPLNIFDDFGNTGLIDAASIHGILIENYLKSTDASIERHMTQMRTQAKAQSKVNADPILRMVQPMNGPMPPGMMRS
jgi:hypothetical protein